MFRTTIAFSLLLVCSVAFAEAPGSPLAAFSADPELASIVKEIDAAHIAHTIQTLGSFHTRHTLSDTKDPARGIGAARNWIKAELESYAKDSGGRMKVEFDVFTAPKGRRIPEPTEVMNVVATLPGTDPKAATREFVVGGHYDSICGSQSDVTCEAPGSNDDASGTAVVLECARVLSKRSFPATIVFVAFVGEEQGLIGATHFAQEAKKANLNVTMLNNDIVGGNKGPAGAPPNDWVRVFSDGPPRKETPEEITARLAGGGEVDTPQRQLARYIEEVQGAYLPGFPARMIWRRDRFGRGGDHTPFSEQGFPAVRFCEAAEDFTRQHANVNETDGVKHGDLFEFVTPEYTANVARLNALTLANLASAPPPPENVRYGTERGKNNTLLSWQASPDNAAGYEVVWRDTTAPRWEHSEPAGSELKFKSDISKDNFFFGVRAVDAKGHRSIVVWPKPPARPAGAPPPEVPSNN